jgi:hypothetical protein
MLTILRIGRHPFALDLQIIQSRSSAPALSVCYTVLSFTLQNAIFVLLAISAPVLFYVLLVPLAVLAAALQQKLSIPLTILTGSLPPTLKVFIRHSTAS